MPHRRLELDGHHANPATLPIFFDGQAYMGRPGESWAQALLAHGVYVLGRSSKYHRRRGMFCDAGRCGQCVAQVGGLPNVLLCQTQIRADGRAQSQNTLPTARADVLAAVDWLFFAGLDHHHLLTQFGPVNRFAVWMARQLGGLGRLPTASQPVEPAGLAASRHVPVAVVGGGLAGLAAADATRRAGLQTVVLEEATGGPAPGGDMLTGHQVVGFYDHRELVVRRPGGLLRLRADIIILATGGYELPPPCPNNDAPGIMSLRAAHQALARGIAPGRRVVVATHPDGHPQAHAPTQSRAAALAAQLQHLGLLGATVGLPGDGPGSLVGIAGSAPNLAVQLAGGHTLSADALVWCARPLPAHELACHMGLETPFDAARGGFVPVHDEHGATGRDGVFVAGELAGVDASEAAAHGAKVGRAAAGCRRIADDVGFA